jgi:hypothetical protein
VHSSRGCPDFPDSLGAAGEKNRYRFWVAIAELEGRYLRVITLEDKVTIHNAFPDRRFRP